MRDFDEWLNTFTDNISNYKFYVDFEKVYQQVENLNIELNILNSLIGSQNIESDFELIINKYPETLKAIPLLLAVRSNEISATDLKGRFDYNFNKLNYSIEDYKYFMEQTGLFDLLKNHIVNNLIDYALGVEVGLNSNARKNRGGKLMEDIVEQYLIKEGFIKGKTYFKEMHLQKIEEIFKLDMTFISNKNITNKRFDFVVFKNNTVYGIETNFYSAPGSKLNETARSYKAIAEEANKVIGFEFIWITDGKGWLNAKNNLKDVFSNTKNIFNLNDLSNNQLTNLLNTQ